MNRIPAITVTGTASVAAVPDLMGISLVVQAHDSQATEAFARAAACARDVISKVLGAVPGAGLATTGISLSARTAWRNEETVMAGYDAETTIEVSRLAVDAVAGVLSAAVAAGGDAVRIHSLRPEVSDPAAAQKTSRELAFANAREKAGQLALLAGARLGAALRVRESAVEPALPLVRVKASPLAAASMPVVAGTTRCFGGP